MGKNKKVEMLLVDVVVYVRSRRGEMDGEARGKMKYKSSPVHPASRNRSKSTSTRNTNNFLTNPFTV